MGDSDPAACMAAGPMASQYARKQARKHPASEQLPSLLPEDTECHLKRALMGGSSELHQSYSTGMWVRRSPGRGMERQFVQFPTSRPDPEMLYRQVQYLVEEDDWAQQGEEVDAPSKKEERGT